MEKNNSQIVIYKDQKGRTKIDVRFDGDTVWLTQAHMAELFQKDRKTITEHISNIFTEAELVEDSVCRKFQHTGKTLGFLLSFPIYDSRLHYNQSK